MMNDDDTWMRVSGARVLGQIGSPDASRIMIKHLVDSDYNVKRMLLSSLRKVLEFDSRKPGFTPDIVKEIKNAIKGIKLFKDTVL